MSILFQELIGYKRKKSTGALSRNTRLVRQSATTTYGLTTPIQQVVVKPFVSSTEVLLKQCEPVTMNSALLALKLYLDDKNATFRGLEQAVALSHVIHRKKDILVSLPTGFGKSSIVFAPALLEKGRVTIVIPFFKSLIPQYQCKLRNAGIQFEVYAIENAIRCCRDIQTRVVIVQIEHVNTTLFRELLIQLNEQNRLGRICIDEIHEIENDKCTKYYFIL
jgi:superfamily II DNA helicase RecQ